MYRRVMHYLFYGVRTSLYTIFFVNISFIGFFFSFPFPFPLFTSFSAAGTARILMLDLAVALNSATYNWPCENTGSDKYTLTLGIVCPYDLLTVIAKLSRIIRKGTSHRPTGIRVYEAEKPTFQRAIPTQFSRLWYSFETLI